jgi:hypothetical protein
MADGFPEPAAYCEFEKQVLTFANVYCTLMLQKYVKITQLLLLACLQHSSTTTTPTDHQYPIPTPKYYLHLLSYFHFILFVHCTTFCSTALNICT